MGKQFLEKKKQKQNEKKTPVIVDRDAAHQLERLSGELVQQRQGDGNHRRLPLGFIGTWKTGRTDPWVASRPLRAHFSISLFLEIATVLLFV